MQIDIYSDMVCPWCRIGKKNLMDALEAWGKKEEPLIRYRAYQLDPSLPPEGLPFGKAMSQKMGGEERLREALDHVTEAGAAVGVTFRFDRVTRMPSTELAHRLVALLPQEDQGAAVDAIMKAHFEEGQDIALPDVLLAAVGESAKKVPELHRRLEAGEGADSVRRDAEEARRIGINGVPFFIFDNRYALSGAYPSTEIVKVLDRIALN